MASYMVLIPQGDRNDPDRARVVRDGFSVFAFLLPLVYLLWHRMWLYAVLLVVFEVALGFWLDFSGQEAAGGVIQFALSLLIALESGTLRMKHLLSRGYVIDDIIIADRLSDTEEIYFSNRGQSAALPSAFAPAQRSAGGAGLTLGLFDMNKER